MSRWLAPFRGLFSAIGRFLLRLGPAGSGRAFGPLSFWFFWTWINNRWYHLQPVYPGAALRYVITTYHGPPCRLRDGTTIRSGDTIAEIHIDNDAISARINAIRGEGKMPEWSWVFVKGIGEALAGLAVPGRLPSEVKALHGITGLAPGSRRLGFEIYPLRQSLLNDLTHFYMNGLLVIYNPEPGRREDLIRRPVYPAHVWMDRRMLHQKYWERRAWFAIDGAARPAGKAEELA